MPTKTLEINQGKIKQGYICGHATLGNKRNL